MVGQYIMYEGILGLHVNTLYTETEMSSFWWNFHHWLHWKLSKWQLPVQPVMKISSKWRHFRFSVRQELPRCQICLDDKLGLHADILRTERCHSRCQIWHHGNYRVTVIKSVETYGEFLCIGLFPILFPVSRNSARTLFDLSNYLFNPTVVY